MRGRSCSRSPTRSAIPPTGRAFSTTCPRMPGPWRSRGHGSAIRHRAHSSARVARDRHAYFLRSMPLIRRSGAERVAQAAPSAVCARAQKAASEATSDHGQRTRRSGGRDGSRRTGEMKRDRESVGALSASANLATPGQGTAAQSARQGPAARPVRRSVTGMDASSPTLMAYQSAIAQMKALPSSDPRNWTNQARIHFDYCPHGNWLFLPWHRAYLLYFERICRQLSGMADFALPYWNWSIEPRVPAPFWSGELLDPNRVATPTSVASPAAVGPPVLASILAETSFPIFGSGSIAATDDQRTMSTYGRLE